MNALRRASDLELATRQGLLGLLHRSTNGLEDAFTELEREFLTVLD